MAKAYVTRGDVTISHVVGRSREGEKEDVVTESRLYPAGAVVREEDMTDYDRERASNGGLDHLLHPLSDEEAKQVSQGRIGDEDFAVFVPEHEAEAHALEVYGHTIVPPDQALELGSSSAQYAADYQGAVREHGLDRRPVQEQFAQERERVPDEVLTGGQHRTGLPYDRGPEDYSGADAEDQHERAEQQQVGSRAAEAEVAAATRQRPGSQAQEPQAQEGQPEHQEGQPEPQGEGQ